MCATDKMHLFFTVCNRVAHLLTYFVSFSQGPNSVAMAAKRTFESQPAVRVDAYFGSNPYGRATSIHP